MDLCFSYRGGLLVSTSWDGTARLWNPQTVREPVSDDGYVAGFSRDDRWLAREPYGPYVGRWEVALGSECRLLRSAGGQGVVRALEFDAEGRLLVVAGEAGAHSWDARAGKEVQVLPLGPTSSVNFDESGRLLITCGAAGIYRWPARWQAEPSDDELRRICREAKELLQVRGETRPEGEVKKTSR
jgi:hypothetical protein